MKKCRNDKYIQPCFDGFVFKDKKVPQKFGGDYLKNSNPKAARPVSTKCAMHVTLRSKIALGGWALCGEGLEERLPVLHDRGHFMR